MGWVRASRRCSRRRAPPSWVPRARTEQLAQTVKEIEDAGGKALGIQADAVSRPDGERVVAQTIDEFGRLDILINNVGGSTYAPFLQITDEDFRSTFDWCVTSAFIMSQLSVPTC